MKPRVFIGSSNESKSIAQAVFENIEDQCEPTLWFHDIFKLSEYSLASLQRVAHDYDFAIFIFADDDERNLRGELGTITRDNVIFECGLFVGALGSHRVFVVQSDNLKFSLPTDLLGWNTTTYTGRSDSNYVASTSTACKRIKSAIAKEGRLNGISLNRYSGAICYRHKQGKTEFLLIETTHGRTMFPKGLAMPDESLEVAALRFAEDEGGVLGRIQINKTIKKRHWKASRTQEQELDLFLVSSRGEKDITENFRNPRWLGYEDALRSVSLNRPAKYAEELRSALFWAKGEIENTNTALHRLAGVLPYRTDGRSKTEVLLITSLTSKNWIIPQGHIEADETPLEAATREASEEAGIDGLVKATPIAAFHFEKKGIAYEVRVFPMLVQKISEEWPEKEKRDRKWFEITDAIEAVSGGGLREVLISFAESNSLPG